MKQRLVAVIYNPHAGTLLQHADKSFEEFIYQLTQSNNLIDIHAIQFSASKLADIQQQVIEQQYDEVWAAGGDGTIISVAKMLKETNIPLGIIPGGTMNLLARDLGFSLDLTQAVYQLIDSTPGYIDVAQLNDEPFFCIANIGLSTRLTETREALRQQPGWIRWPRVAFETIKNMFVYPPLKIRVVTPDSEINIRTRALSVSNNPLGESIGLIPERYHLNKGLLGIYITRSRSLWTLPKLVLKFINGSWKQDTDILDIETPKADIYIDTHRTMKVMIDGELHKLAPPYHFHVRPNALNILKPNVPQKRDL